MNSLTPDALMTLSRSAATLRLLSGRLLHDDAQSAFECDRVADSLMTVVGQAQLEEDRYQAWMESRYQDECERARTFTDQDLIAAGGIPG